MRVIIFLLCWAVCWGGSEVWAGASITRFNLSENIITRTKNEPKAAASLEHQHKNPRSYRHKNRIKKRSDLLRKKPANRVKAMAWGIITLGVLLLLAGAVGLVIGFWLLTWLWVLLAIIGTQIGGLLAIIGVSLWEGFTRTKDGKQNYTFVFWVLGFILLYLLSGIALGFLLGFWWAAGLCIGFLLLWLLLLVIVGINE